MTTIRKGDTIRARWIDAKPCCLTGQQMKLGATIVNVEGVVRHVRGNHLTEPTEIRLYIDADHELATVRPPGCRCHSAHVEVMPARVVGAWR